MNKDYLLGNSNNIAPSAVYVKKAAGEYVKIWDRTDDLKTPPIDVDYETVDEQADVAKNLPPVENKTRMLNDRAWAPVASR